MISVEMVENYTDSKKVKMLTADRLHIPGLCLLGWQTRMAASDSLAPHDHGSRFEIVYVCSGTPSFTVGGKTYVLSGGDIFITRPYEVHSTDSMPVSVSEIYWIQVDFEHCANVLFLDQTASSALEKRLSGMSGHVVSGDPRKLKPLIQEAFQTAYKGKDPQFAAQYLTLFLYLMLDCSGGQNRITPDIGCSVTYILDHITEKLTLDAVAQTAYLSTSQFKQKFKQEMGISPRQFINTQKIEYAKKLIRSGSSIAEAASCLQFDNMSYFATVFKRYTSLTPSEYRRENCPDEIKNKGMQK